MKPALSDIELERIRTSIARAEEGTSGEIVPFVVARSDRYEVVMWRGAAAAAALFLVATLLIYLFYRGWSLGWLYTGIGMALGIVASFLIGIALVVWSPRAFRLVAGQRLLASRVRGRAERAFIKEGVFRTKQRTGILILVSLQERRIEILVDEGISKVVPTDSWSTVVEAARTELRRGDLAEALVAGVDACGAILRESGLTATRDDLNELGDELRFGAEG